jgi:c-di-GMP-binding flagellar brake protein YcgR
VARPGGFVRDSSPMKERRRHVRIKPTASQPARAVREIDALMHETLEIIDISVGGMAISDASLAVGATTKLKLSLTGHGEHLINVEVRWVANGAAGVTFVDPPAAAAHAVQRYVAELLEVGAAV